MVLTKPPIFITGSTNTLIHVRATDFVYDNGYTAVVHLSSVQNFGQLITLTDYDNFCGTDGAKIKLSTTSNVYFDYGDAYDGSPSGLSSFIFSLTKPGQVINVMPRTPTQWTTTQQTIAGELDPSKLGITISGIDFLTLDAQLVAVSTTMRVYGSTLTAVPQVTSNYILTSPSPLVTTLPAIKSLSLSTGQAFTNDFIVQRLTVNSLTIGLLSSISSLYASTISTGVTTLSSLRTQSLGFSNIPLDGTNNTLTFSNGSTLWNGGLFDFDANNKWSSLITFYNNNITLAKQSDGLSSISTTITDIVSSIAVGSIPFSSFVATETYNITNAPYLPGISSLSTMIPYAISSLSVSPAVSTLSTVMRLGFSNIGLGPGISSMSTIFSKAMSTVASGPGLSSFSTYISKQVSTINTPLQFNLMSSALGYGLSDIAVTPGLSTLSTLLVTTVSSLQQGSGVSSLSSFICGTMSSYVFGTAVSTLQTYYLQQSTVQDTSAGVSSLSTILFSTVSSLATSAGLSSLSSVVSYALSTVNIPGALSSISTTFEQAFLTVTSGPGLSSLSTLTSLTLSSLNINPGISSFLRDIQTAFSTTNDMRGMSSLSTAISVQLSSIYPFGSPYKFYPFISTTFVNTSTVRFWDQKLQQYFTFYENNGLLYINGTNINVNAVQPNDLVFTSLSTFWLQDTGLFAASNVSAPTILMVPSPDPKANTIGANSVSTIQLSTNLLVTNTVSLYDFTTNKWNSIIASNGHFFYNTTTQIDDFGCPGVSSLSTTIIFGLSTMSNINPRFDILTQRFSTGLSTVAAGPGLSSLSTLVAAAADTRFLAGLSTNNLIASTVYVSSLSFFAQDSRTNITSTLTTSSLVATNVFGGTATIGDVQTDKVFVSTFDTSVLDIRRIFAVSTLVRGFMSTGVASSFSTITPTFAQLAPTLISTILTSTIGVYDATANRYLPLFVSTSSNNTPTVFFNGKDIQTPIEPLIVKNLYLCTIVTSTMATPVIPLAKAMTTLESIEVTQSTLGIWNRSVLTTNGAGGGNIVIGDAIQYSHDGLTWSNTNYVVPTRFGLDTATITKPSYNGVYWLVGTYISSGNSVLYSPDGLNYSAIESGQFTTNALNCTWNGQYWLAGDYTGDSNGSIKKSFDGITWTPNTLGGFENGAVNFAWNGSMWVACGFGIAQSNIQFSYDGVNWYNEQDNAFTTTDTTQATAVCWTGKRWIVSGAASVYGLLWSDDGKFWTGVVNLTNGSNFYDVKWNGKVAVAVGFNMGPDNKQTFAYSSDGVVWNYGNGWNFQTGTYQYGKCYSVDWNGERWIATGNTEDYSTAIAYSFDGVTWYQGSNEPNTGGQGIGFASNVLPALDTPTLKVYPNGKGYIPNFTQSTNTWQVSPSSIVMNNNLIINRDTSLYRNIGINTISPSTPLDVVGTLTVANQAFMQILRVPTPTNNYILGSTFTSQLTIGTPPSLTRTGVIDCLFTPNSYGMVVSSIWDGAAQSNAKTILNTSLQQGGASMMPFVGTTGNTNLLYWVWNNPGANSYFTTITGTAIPFTGQHAVDVSGVTQDTVTSYVGLIVKSSDKGYLSYDLNAKPLSNKSAIWSTEALPLCELTQRSKEKACFGVISDYTNADMAVDFNTMQKAYVSTGFGNELYGRLYVNSVGDGAIWVTSLNGPLKSGDYICSSEVAGHGMRQEEPYMTNYTVAKATMSCDFDLRATAYKCEEIPYQGQIIRRAFVGCTYHCG